MNDNDDSTKLPQD